MKATSMPSNRAFSARKFGRRLAAALQRSLYVLVIVSLLAGSLPGLAVQAASAADAAPTPTDARLPFETAVATDVFEVTGTPEATATAVLTDTQPAPTVTMTATPTVSPTVMPTVTVTPTVTLTPTVTATPAPTPVVTVDPPVIVAAASALTLTWEGPSSLALSVQPAAVNPGEPFTLTWKFAAKDEKAESLALTLAIPAGMQPLGQAAESFDPQTRRLRLPLTAQGNQPMALLADAVAPFTLQVSVVRTDGDDKPLASGTLAIAQDGVAALSVDGGEVSGLNGRVKVHFPQNAYAPAGKSNGEAAPQGMDVRIRPLGAAHAEAERLNGYEEALPPYTLSGNAFEISAWGQEDKASVHQFSEPITIEVHYDESQIDGDESTLTLSYWDETYQTWMSLPSYVDAHKNVIYATSDHLSSFDFDSRNWQAPRLPNMQAFQVSSFTGAASYSFPIEVPPGPGGLQPSLSLSYNSQTADSASGYTQASWVGMGWSLDSGGIERNMNGTMNDFADDTYRLTLNGTGYQLYKDSSGNWRTSDESFLHIVRNTNVWNDENDDTWEIWDQAGNKYYFGLENDASISRDRLNYVYFDCGDGSTTADDVIEKVTWRWMLSKTTNIHGVELIYRNSAESKHLTSICSSSDSEYMDRAGYMQQIVYAGRPDASNDSHYRVYFQRDETRTDFDHGWPLGASHQYFFTKSRLTAILIQHSASGNGSFSDAVTTRKYAFTYASGAANDPTIFPNYVWTEGGRTLTLKKIEEYGLNDTGPLPATTFTYGDGMHLTNATNGYGGKVDFTYVAWNETTNLKSSSLIMEGPSLCNNGDRNGWWGNASCVGEHLSVTGTAYKTIKPGMIRFGGRYRVVAYVGTVATTDALQIGIGDSWATTPTYLPVPAAALSSSFIDVDVTLTLQPSAQVEASFFLKCTDCRIDRFYAYPVQTRYRVLTKTVTDNVTGQASPYGYRYDEPASNDTVHSAYIQSIPTTTPDGYAQYFKEYSEFRGHAMVEEEMPDDTVNTTFFYQDDTRKGKPSVAMLWKPEYIDHFHGSSSLWALENLSWNAPRWYGDPALQLTYSGTNWGANIRRNADSISDGDMAMVQFQVKGSTAAAVLAVEDGAYPNADHRRWGLYAHDNVLELQYQAGSGWVYQTLLSSLKRDCWYVLLLGVDNQSMFIRVWERDNVTDSTVGRYELATPASMQNLTWRFRAWANNTGTGSVLLDGYSEGLLSSLTESQYDVTTTNMPDLPILPSGGWYTGFKVVWTRLVGQKSMIFNGDAQWVGTKTTYTYDAYGNQSEKLEAEWRSGSWYNYRATRSGYHTGATSGVYLVGLPSYVNSFQCPGGTCGYTASQLIGQALYLYDGSNAHTTTPSTGKLTGQRTLLSCLSGDCTPTANLRYSDVRYAYDSYGNQTTVTAYTGEGAYGGAPQGTAQYTYTCYGGGTLNGQPCSDTYHTYPLWTMNDLGHKVTLSYDYVKGVVLQETDANGQVTSGTYDAYGRMLTIVRPGDSSSSPTVRITYGDTAQPFYTQAEQRIENSTYFTIRKYYNGLGQLLQTQVRNATVEGSVQDILTDSYYDASGRVYRQTVPYNVSPTGGYNATEHNSHSTDDATTTRTWYDDFGRTKTVCAPDGACTGYTYGDGYNGTVPYQWTMVEDARHNFTTTRSDLFGRTVFVDAPTGPDVTYTYDAADHLKTTVRGGSTTTLTYDVAGRKTQMNDPDMGIWNYSYDAIGNLKTQTDARGCVTTMAYDDLNRLTAKAYTGSCGSGNTNASYGYDAYGTGQYGRGRRTSMTDGSGSTAWTYDERGRVKQEAKTVSGTTYNTYWEYNAADLPKTMTYPDGEVITHAYLPQMLLDTLMSNRDNNNAANNYYYVLDTRYDSAGRTTSRWLGGAYQATTPVLVNSFHYNAWNVQGGRMDYIKAGTYSSQASLMDLRYTYDAVGNITKIEDYKLGNPQTLGFGYDALNRLTGAYAGSGTNGLGNFGYEQYTYNATTGNLEDKAGLSFGYSDANHDHAVTTVDGDTRYTYDANGNQTQRKVSDQEPNLIPNADFESSGSWTGEIVDFPATSFYRSTWGASSPHSGAYGYAISNQAYGTLVSTDYIAVNAADTYNLHAWVRGEVDAEGTADGWHVRVMYYNASDTYLGNKDTAFGAGGSLSTTWTQKGGSFTPMAGTTKVKIQLIADMISGWVAFDDVSLIKSGTSTNLVSNAAFESTSGWTEGRSSAYPGTSFWRGNWGLGDGHSTGTDYAYVISNLAYGHLASPQIAVTPGAQYDVYAWVRGELDPDDSEGQWLIRVNYFDAAGNYLNDYDDAAGGQAGTLTKVWVQRGGRITIPSAASKVNIALYNYHNAGWVAYDDVSLIKVGTSTNLVTNPGFETAGTWAEGLQPFFPGTSFWRYNWSIASPHSGSYAYAISNLANGYLRTEAIAVTPGAEYDLYAWVRGKMDADDGEGPLLLRVQYYNAAGTYLRWEDVAAISTTDLSTTWRQEGARFTVPSDAAQVRVMLLVHLSSGWIGYDDISLRKVSTFDLSYDAENRLYQVRKDGSVISTHTYDGDGKQVKVTTGENVTVYAGSYEVEQPNLLPNPSIEQAGSGSADAYGWTEGTNHARANDRAHSGSWSLKSTHSGSPGTATYTTVVVQPNTLYELSGWIYKQTTSGAVYLDLSGATGQPVLLASANGSWQYVSGVWYSGANTSVTVRMVTDSNISGTAWFDDISLRVSTATNPSFEQAGTSSSDVAGWNEGTNHIRSNDRAHSGSWSLKSNHTGSPGTSTNSSAIAVRPNTNYLLSGWIYKQATSGAAYLDMNGIAGQLVLPATTTGSWQYVSGIWYSGSNTSIIIRMVTDTNINGPAWFDDVSLVAQDNLVRKYYTAGGQRIAMRENGTLRYLLSDHLGSTSVVADAAGNKISEMRYKPWGEVRYTSGTTPTDYTYTGQRSEMESIGLMFYNARWYDPTLGRFTSPDTIIPEQSQGVQAWDRYAYVNNNPVDFSDPTGHCLVLCTAAIGAGIGAIVGAVGYTIYTAATGTEFNTGHMLAAAGGGAVAGGLIGTGVGVVAGMNAAAATTAAVTGGSTVAAANGACGGDVCAGEIKDAATAVNTACGGDMCAGEVGEIADDASTAVSNLWSKTSYNGTTVYQRSDLIDPTKVSAAGKTNLQLMQSGRAPIGPDGLPINLHHMLQNMNGPIAEVTKTFHQTYSRIIHINPNTIPSGIDRVAFNAWRMQYWIERAKDFSQE